MDVQIVSQLMNKCWGGSIDKHNDNEKFHYHEFNKPIADNNKDDHIDIDEMHSLIKKNPDKGDILERSTQRKVYYLNQLKSNYKNNPGINYFKKGNMIDEFGVLNDKETIDMLSKILTTEKSWDVRKKAAFHLGAKCGNLKEYAGKKLIEAIPYIENFNNQPGMVFGPLFSALGELKHKEAVPYLINALNNQSKRYKSSFYHIGAIIGLCKIGDMKYIKEFKAGLLKNKDEKYDCIEGEDPFPYIKYHFGVTKFNKEYMDTASKILRHEFIPEFPIED